jgi:hypothetical protein
MTSPPPPGAKMGGSDLTYVKVPARYASQAKTDLKVSLAAGKNSHDFDLKD